MKSIEVIKLKRLKILKRIGKNICESISFAYLVIKINWIFIAMTPFALYLFPYKYTMTHDFMFLVIGTIVFANALALNFKNRYPGI